MDRRRSERAQRGEMLGRAVALVLREAVAGKASFVLAHYSVARHLGENRGGCDAEALAVAAHDRGLRMLQARDPASVDQYVAGRASQAGQRAQARLARGPVDVKPVDLGRFGDPDSPYERARSYLAVQFLTHLGQELLRIVNALDESLGGEYDRGRHHRTPHRADPGLVDARHHFHTAAPELALVTEIRMLRHRAATPPRAPCALVAGYRRGFH